MSKPNDIQVFPEISKIWAIQLAELVVTFSKDLNNGNNTIDQIPIYELSIIGTTLELTSTRIIKEYIQEIFLSVNFLVDISVTFSNTYEYAFELKTFTIHETTVFTPNTLATILENFIECFSTFDEEYYGQALAIQHCDLQLHHNYNGEGFELVLKQLQALLQFLTITKVSLYLCNKTDHIRLYFIPLYI